MSVRVRCDGLDCPVEIVVTAEDSALSASIATADSFGGARIAMESRLPKWTRTPGGHLLCPACALARFEGH